MDSHRASVEIFTLVGPFEASENALDRQRQGQIALQHSRGKYDDDRSACPHASTFE